MKIGGLYIFVGHATGGLGEVLQSWWFVGEKGPIHLQVGEHILLLKDGGSPYEISDVSALLKNERMWLSRSDLQNMFKLVAE